MQEWRKGVRRAPSRLCMTCTAPPVILYALDEFLKDMAKGDSGSMAQFFDKVLVPLGFKVSLPALMRHLQLHEKRWRR